MNRAVIVGYVRSPFQFASKGAFVRLRPDDMAAEVVKALVAQVGIPPSDIEDLILGCSFPEGEQGLNLARSVVFLASLPDTIAGTTVNRYCGSSMQAIHMAAGAIALGAGRVFICCGVESMSRVPMMGFNPLPNPKLAPSSVYISMGRTAENIARRYQITRLEQDAFAVASQTKAASAVAAGYYAADIQPIQGVDRDGCPRPGTTMEALAGLRPAFDEAGTVTAGTSSPLTDGAAGVMVVAEDYAKAHGLPVLARIRSAAVSGCAPEIMGIGPVVASQRALERAGLTVAEIGVVELNEAFASQALAVVRDLAVPEARLNQDGGAIALGHPLGASGARITGQAARILKRRGEQFALATMCIGGGQGIATVLEAV